jgi:hypothetical protein
MVLVVCHRACRSACCNTVQRVGDIELRDAVPGRGAGGCGENGSSRSGPAPALRSDVTAGGPLRPEAVASSSAAWRTRRASEYIGASEYITHANH